MENQYVNNPMTMQQAAYYSNKTYEAFRYWVRSPYGPKAIMLGNRKFFTREELDKWKPVDKRKKK